MVHKPARWAVTQGEVEAEWQWAWNGLVGCFALIDPNSRESYDLVSWQQNTLSGSGHEVVYRPAGLAFRPTATANANAIETGIPIDPNYGGPFTAAISFHTDSRDQSGQVRTLLSQLNGSGLGRSWLSVEASTNNYDISTFLGGSSTQGNVTPNASDNLAVVRYSSEEGRIWVGVSGDWKAGNQLRTMESADGDLRIGNHKTASNGSAEHPIYALYVWSTVLEDSQLDALYADPFGPIRPRQLQPAYTSADSDTRRTKVWVP